MKTTKWFLIQNDVSDVTYTYILHYVLEGWQMTIYYKFVNKSFIVFIDHQNIF